MPESFHRLFSTVENVCESAGCTSLCQMSAGCAALLVFVGSAAMSVEDDALVLSDEAFSETTRLLQYSAASLGPKNSTNSAYVYA